MIFRAAILILATAALAAAADDPIAAIIDQARGAPAEIFADVAFRLLDSNRVAEKDRVPLLEEVFLRADEARQPVPTRPAEIPPPLPRTVGLHLDALSIKCRAVKALLAVDGKRARARFGEITPPHIPKPDCKGAILLEPTVYFETLADVVTRAPFTEEEQQKQVPFWMMADAVRRIQTSLEIIAAARNLSHLVHRQNDALAMSSAFAAALSIDDCNRNFTAAMNHTNLVDAVLMAADRFAALGAPPQTMRAALRSYLVRHLTASRCEDSPGQEYETSLSLFNSTLAGQTVVPPISEEETKPAKFEGKAERATQPVQDDFLALGKDVDAILGLAPLVSGMRRLTTQDIDAINARDVVAEVQRVLTKLREWKGSPEQDAIDVFHRKADLYLSLLSGSRPPFQTTASFRPAILSGLIATLEDTAILDAAPSDWLSEVWILDRPTMHASSSNGGKEVSIEWVPTDIAQAMTASNLSALSVYGHLRAFESPPPPLLPPNREF